MENILNKTQEYLENLYEDVESNFRAIYEIRELVYSNYHFMQKHGNTAEIERYKHFYEEFDKIYSQLNAVLDMLVGGWETWEADK